MTLTFFLISTRINISENTKYYGEIVFETYHWELDYDP